MTNASDSAQDAPIGALCWENWKGFEASTDPPVGAYMRAEEANLLSDVSFNGGLIETIGPYTLFNLISHGATSLAESLALRYSLHLPEQSHTVEIPEKPATDSWLGLTLDEEVSALLSLFLSIRIRSAGVTRQFPVDSDDPAGTPVAYSRVRPELALSQRRILPRVSRPRAFLGDVPELLGRLPTLNASESVALTRCAHQYQMAVWVADSDPELAWLQLVSAVEVAATHWRGQKVDAVAGLKELYPKIVGKLNDEEQVKFVARQLKKLIGSTQRFLDFMEEFDPGPPVERCEEHFQISWTDLRRRLTLVYRYRSNRLHSGEPFPPVMNQEPMASDQGAGWYERPFGVAHFAGSTQWPSDAIPMYLWFFERLVQGALLRWYRESLGSG
ncbi:hypothetical protein [Mycobacterium sp. 852013-51886_SCH5428379]|uniref:hypothetical protein n=1 Tax=Mycobacterium sp. 852013-51886_SCH5428379 TaxID=1834111 RepID=UPI000A4EEDC3|nr:hypothetical protein [Mycobacterium sp. 852013-51886_SCH5428379]